VPEPLSLSEVSARILDAKTLPELERYIVNLLPNRSSGDSQVLAQALWNTRGNDMRGMGGFEAEFRAQWSALMQRLRTQYELVDDLEQVQADRRRSNITRDGEVRIKIEKEINDQLRQRAGIQQSIRREEMGQPMVDPQLREQRSGSGVDGVTLRPGAVWPSRVQEPPQQPSRKPFYPESVPPLSEDARRLGRGFKRLFGFGSSSSAQTGESGEVKRLQEQAREAAERARANDEKLKNAEMLGGMVPEVGPLLGAAAAATRAKQEAKAAKEQAKIQRKIDKASMPKGPSDGTGICWAFFWFTLLVHVLVVGFYGMSLPPVFYVLGTLLISIVWWLANDFSADEFKTALWISLAASFPYVIAAYSDALFSSSPDIAKSVVVIAMVVPIWPLAMWARAASRSQSSAPRFWLKVYFGLLILCFIVFVIWPIVGSRLGALPALGERVDVGSSALGFWDLLTERWERVFTRIGTISSLYTNPNYYTGTVDENQGKPLGVTISDLRPLDEEIANDTAITLFANVETKSFVGESAQIVPGCAIERSNTQAVPYIDPPVLDVVYGTTGSFECSFEPPTEGWRTGVYAVTASATFPFQTWAYIPYVFVDEERARNIARQGQDLRDVLDIEQDADAVYTSGPVVMGMGGTDQPILVRRDDAKNGWLAAGSRIGVTLDSGWQDGEITAVRALELKVPEGFVLTGCDRPVTSTAADPNAVGYTTYVFENPPDTSVAIDYLTITCKLGLADAEAASNLVSAGDKAERTFVAVARYEYTTEERDSVRVR